MSDPAATSIEQVVAQTQADRFCALVWEFFDVLRGRYPEMLDVLDKYIEQQGVEDELANLLANYTPPNGACFLGFAGDTAVGTVMLKRIGDNDCEMNRMYVRDTARGQGLGRALCVRAVDQARAMGFDAIYLDAAFRHVEALPLYESVGFQRFSDPNAFGGDDDRIIHMKLTLKG